MGSAKRLCLFALQASADCGARVADALGIGLSAHEERDFEDGEHKTRPLISVRGCDVFVIQSLYGEPRQSVNDKLCRLLFFVGALKDASADRVTAIIPYLSYARKDRKTQPRDPVTTRYVASLFEAVGTDRVLALEVHNLAAFQNAFRLRTEHLEASTLFARYFAGLLHEEDLVIVSPDAGGIKRAERLRQELSRLLDTPVANAFMEKYRSEGVVSGNALVGTVADRTAIVIDDLISTGGTLVRAANACHENGAANVYAAATHGLFVGTAEETLCSSRIKKIVVTNTVPPLRLTPETVAHKLAILDTSALFAEAIKRIHEGGSLVDLVAP
jgi:ribose-phosphate pyrophosphokinase